MRASPERAGASPERAGASGGPACRGQWHAAAAQSNSTGQCASVCCIAAGAGPHGRDGPSCPEPGRRTPAAPRRSTHTRAHEDTGTALRDRKLTAQPILARAQTSRKRAGLDCTHCAMASPLPSSAHSELHLYAADGRCALVDSCAHGSRNAGCFWMLGPRATDVTRDMTCLHCDAQRDHQTRGPRQAREQGSAPSAQQAAARAADHPGRRQPHAGHAMAQAPRRILCSPPLPSAGHALAARLRGRRQRERELLLSAPLSSF